MINSNTSCWVNFRHNARLGDGDALLLHGLVDTGPVLVVHLVELVDETDALVGQHQGPGLLGDLGAGHVGGETHGRRALAGGEDGARRDALDVLEELRLGRPGVAAHQHVDVPTDLGKGDKTYLTRSG